MNYKKKYTLISFIVVAIVLTTILIVFSIFIPRGQENPIKIYKDNEIFKQIMVEFDTFHPGDEKKYALQFEGVYDGKYALNFDFNEINNGDLKKYLNVVIKKNGEIIYSSSLLDLISGNCDLYSELIILKREVVEFEIYFIMPETIGNEAQNAEGTFNISIVIKETEVM